MANPQTPGVFVSETAPKVTSIPALPTAISAIIGIAQKGPINTSTLVTSFDEYVDIFGGFTTDADMTLGAQGFFTNGGQELWVTRIVHLTDITNPATKTSAIGTLNLLTAGGAPSGAVVQGTGIAPYDLEPGQFVRGNVESVGNQDATLNATLATLTAGNVEPYVLADSQTLTGNITRVVAGAPEVNPFVITFLTGSFPSGIATAPAAEVAVVMNAILSPFGAFVDVTASAVRINTNQRGTGSTVEVSGGTANVALGFSITPTSGTGNVANIDAVMDTEAKSIIEAALTNGSGVTYSNAGGGEPIITTNALGAGASILIDAATTATAFGFDNALHVGSSGAPDATLQVDGKYDGAYANALRLEVLAPTSGGANDFNLEVQETGVAVETYEDVSMFDITAVNYVVNVINGASTLIEVTDLASTAANPNPAVGIFGPLTGGDDGLAGLVDADLLGSEAGPTGLHTFNTVRNLSLIMMPGFSSGAVQAGLIDYIEVFRRGLTFGLLDIPPGLTAQEAVDHMENNNLVNLSSKVAFYWPHIQIVNPSTTVFGDAATIVVAPSGHDAGIYANNDRIGNRGVWDVPGGIVRGIVRGAVGFETDETLDERKRALVYRVRVNPITTKPGQPIHLGGARTGKAIANFPTIGEQRGVIFVSQSLEDGLAFLEFEPNIFETRNTAARVVTAFLLDQMRRSAFASKNAEDAFFVQCDENNNPPSVIDQGKLIIDVGLATAKPAEFILVQISKDTRAQEEELATT